MKKNNGILKFYVMVNRYGLVFDQYYDRKEALHYYHLMGGKREGLEVMAAAIFAADADEDEWVDIESNLGKVSIARSMTEAVRNLKNNSYRVFVNY